MAEKYLEYRNYELTEIGETVYIKHGIKEHILNTNTWRRLP